MTDERMIEFPTLDRSQVCYQSATHIPEKIRGLALLAGRWVGLPLRWIPGGGQKRMLGPWQVHIQTLCLKGQYQDILDFSLFGCQTTIWSTGEHDILCNYGPIYNSLDITEQQFNPNPRGQVLNSKLLNIFLSEKNSKIKLILGNYM